MSALDTPDLLADGRRRRSANNRARIVAAMLELVAEDDPQPSAEAVAARAGVGLRTVFRHFRDMDSLYAEMSAHIWEAIAPLVAEPLRGASWRERLAELVRRRAEVFERIAPYYRASAVQRASSKVLADGHVQFVAAARARLEGQLPADLPDRAVLIEMLDLLLSFEAWDRLRSDQGLSAEAARALVEAGVERLTAG